MVDGTSTQVKVQMINRCRVKMSQKGLYKLRDSPQNGDPEKKKKKEEKGENICIICILFRQFI